MRELGLHWTRCGCRCYRKTVVLSRRVKDRGAIPVGYGNEAAADTVGERRGRDRFRGRNITQLIFELQVVMAFASAGLHRLRLEQAAFRSVRAIQCGQRGSCRHYDHYGSTRLRSRESETEPPKQ